MSNYIAPEGTVWVCGACGKHGKDRMSIGDEACFLNAILCHENSLVKGRGGMVIKADPVESGKGSK